MSEAEGVASGGEIAFSGVLDSGARRDIQALYLRRKPVYPILYSAMGAVLVWLGFLRAGASLEERLTLGLFAVLCFSLAFALQHVWWWFWWPGFEMTHASGISGVVTREGLRWMDSVEAIPWRDFLAVEANDSTVLLYLTRSRPLPLHRSFFADAHSWLAALEAIPRKNAVVWG